ncbi:MAG TPA: glycosyltransferase [Phycisphaerales bacterium]|nr:glycosyltransferase [Phycisphaerales bacterium]
MDPEFDHHHPRRRIEFCILSFEGPDLYSLVGGLGVRVTEMTKMMARLGYNTRLFFVGDPDCSDYEVSEDGLLHYHRWSRWLSKQYPEGVYHGEMAKVEDYQKSLPEFLVNRIVKANAEKGVTTVVLGEDWQTAQTVIRIKELLKKEALESSALLFWNANNVFGFEAIDFKKLAEACTILTISRYMKEKMRAMDIKTVVVANGIPPRFWSRVDKKTGEHLRELFPGTLLAKIGRYHPDKRWLMAMESCAHMKKMGMRPTLLVRGGREKYGQTVRDKAAELGLSWDVVRPEKNDNASILEALEEKQGADIIELDFFVPEAFLRTLYWASTAVLANSGHEPFGLVGLEVMACTGLCVVGSTGEEYVHHFHNGISISSDDPRELALYLEEIWDDHELSERIRNQGRATAKLYNWDSIVFDLLRKVELVAWSGQISLHDALEKC